MPSDMVSVFTKDSEFWEKYLKGRPQPPDSFYEQIFKYHEEHGGQFNTVHDAGAGAGIHSAALANRFNKVIVTDVGEENISAAKSRLDNPDANFEFHVTKLEDTPNVIPPASVDLFFAATMLHFTDIDKALQAVAHQLKPGGTFNASATGPFRLDDPAVQDIWLKIFHVGLRNFYARLYDNSATDQLIKCSGSGYDYIALPESIFEPGALRLKYNMTIEEPYTDWYPMFVMPELREKYPLVSRIGKSEKVVRETDEAWFFSKDIGELKDNLASFPFEMEAEEMKPLIKELEDAVGERKVNGRWFVVNILATRK